MKICQHTSTEICPTVCSVFDKGYRYGFNGMEHDRDIANDGYDFGARIYDGRLGRWLSLDPFMDEYPSENPYCGIGNSPMFFIDNDGNKIWIYYTTEVIDDKGNKSTKINKVQYKKGKIYDENGNKLKTSPSEYVTKVKENLDFSRKIDKRFKKDIDKLSSNKSKDHNIKPFELKTGNAKNTNGNLTEPETLNPSIGVSQGSTIYYDPNLNKSPNGEDRPAVIGLIHEIKHAIQYNDATFINNIFAKGPTGRLTGVILAESEAVTYENIMRAYLLQIIRDEYEKEKLGDDYIGKDEYDKIYNETKAKNEKKE